MLNGAFVRMSKGSDEKVFYVFPDGTYRTSVKCGWSEISEDFADEYIKLRESGWEEA